MLSKIFQKIKIYWRAGLISILLLMNFFVWSAVFAEDRGGKLTIAFLDVGQGDAIFIDSPVGNQVLIDAGPNASVLRELSKVMPFYDRSLDLAIATHPDQDHIGGLPEVLRRFFVTAYMDPGVSNDTAIYQSLVSALEKENLSYQFFARRDMKIELGRGAYLEILFPDRDVSGLETNDASVVAQLVYGETEVMLTGDSPKKIENYLTLLEGNSLRADILKVGHHGSKTSSSEYFLAAVSPAYSVISAGKDNRYGHPHKEVIDRLEKSGGEILNTGKSGTIIFVSDGVTIRRK